MFRILTVVLFVLMANEVLAQGAATWNSKPNTKSSSKVGERLEDAFGFPNTGKMVLGVGGLYQTFHGVERFDHFGVHASAQWMPPSMDGKKNVRSREPDRFFHFVLGADYTAFPSVLAQPPGEDRLRFLFSEVFGRVDFFFVKAQKGFCFLGPEINAKMHMPGNVHSGMDDWSYGGHGGFGFAPDPIFSFQFEGGAAYHPRLGNEKGTEWWAKGEVAFHIAKPGIDIRLSYQRRQLALKNADTDADTELNDRNILSAEVLFHFSMNVGLYLFGSMDLKSSTHESTLNFWHGEIGLKFAF